MMTELEKLDAGLEYCFTDPGVEARKAGAASLCRELNAVPHTDRARQEPLIRKLFGKAGRNPVVLANFQCDNGKNIRVGDEFLANYNVTILDIAP